MSLKGEDFPQRMMVHIVSIDGEIAGAMACCVLREGRYIWWIGGVNARRDLKTNEFLMWEVIQHAKSEGFKTLDLIGADSQRLSRFKSKFDPVLEPYCYVEKTDALGKIAKFVYARLGEKQILPRGRSPNGKFKQLKINHNLSVLSSYNSIGYEKATREGD